MSPTLRLLRPHQWTKNALLLLPLLFAHRLDEAPLLGSVVLAVAAFSLMASAVYVLNDLRDLEADRLHPHKRERPFAAGTVSTAVGPALSGGLAVCGLALAGFTLPWSFTVLLLVYLAANLGYSFGMKRVPVLDVVVLTLMFVLRILAGGRATGVAVSDWLLSFSLFFFLSLALAKRAQEVLLTPDADSGTMNARGYRRTDLPWISQLGMAAGLVSVLVLALYVRDGDMIGDYASPRLLWLCCPLLLLWIGRIWLRTLRGEMPDDPVGFALRDPVSYAVLLLTGLVMQTAFTAPWPF